MLSGNYFDTSITSIYTSIWTASLSHFPFSSIDCSLQSMMFIMLFLLVFLTFLKQLSFHMLLDLTSLWIAYSYFYPIFFVVSFKSCKYNRHMNHLFACALQTIFQALIYVIQVFIFILSSCSCFCNLCLLKWIKIPLGTPR